MILGVVVVKKVYGVTTLLATYSMRVFESMQVCVTVIVVSATVSLKPATEYTKLMP